MDHTTQFLGRVPSENPERILMSISDVENYRKFHPPRQIQLIEKPDIV